MTVVDGEEGASRPLVDLLELGPDDVEDNAHAILIIITNNTLMRVCRVAADNAVLLACKLGRMVAGNVSINLLLLHLHVLLLLLHRHDEAAVRRQLVLTLGLLQAALAM